MVIMSPYMSDCGLAGGKECIVTVEGKCSFLGNLDTCKERVFMKLLKFSLVNFFPQL